MKLPTIRKSVLLAPEMLEDRTTPTTATLSGGILRVMGTSGSESIRVIQTSSLLSVVGVRSFYSAGCSRIYVNAGSGNDTVDLRTCRIPASVNADNGNDLIYGSQQGDYILAGGGNDLVYGMQGNDTLRGNAGNDRLFGNDGYDKLYGDENDDFLDDGNRYGAESLSGGTGLDWNADVVAVSGAKFDDIHQRSSPTCGFLSSLSGLARTGTNFTQWIYYAGPSSSGVPIYKVAFWNTSSWYWQTVSFDGTRYSSDPAPDVEGESWVILMHRAWRAYTNTDGRCWPDKAIYRLVGRNATYQHYVVDSDFVRIRNAINSNQVTVTATPNRTLTTRRLIRDHAYTVIATWGTGTNLWVQVRNPWGYDGGAETSGDAYDGLVWVTWYDFRSSMTYLAFA